MTAKLLTVVFLLQLSISFSGFAQDRRISYNDVKDKAGEVLEPFKDYDIADGKLNLSLTMTNIPTAIDKAKIQLVEKIGDTDKPINGAKQNEDGGVYELKFDLTTTAKDFDNIATKLLQIKISDKVVAKFNITPGSKDPTDKCASQTEFQTQAGEFVSEQIRKLGLKKKQGLLVGAENVIHMFIDQYGKFYGRAIPTNATPDHRFQLHLITSECDAKNYNFSFSYEGEVEEEFSVNNTFKSAAKEGLIARSSTITFLSIDYPVIGTFSRLSMKLEREDAATKVKQTLLDATVPIAKKYHVTIAAGMFATSLKNPKNIEKYVMPSGDTTLIADDDINSRGMFTIMATFYPRGRSSLYYPSGNLLNRDRLGFVVGAQLGDGFRQNFFLGLTTDIARGCSLSAGVHYGRRSFIPRNRSFNFGKDIFTGELKVKEQWVPGVYFGVVIDARILGMIFPGLSQQ